jgi:hypothetical protein
VKSENITNGYLVLNAKDSQNVALFEGGNVGSSNFYDGIDIGNDANHFYATVQAGTTAEHMYCFVFG